MARAPSIATQAQSMPRVPRHVAEHRNVTLVSPLLSDSDTW